MLLIKQLFFVISSWAATGLIPCNQNDIRPLMLPWVILFVGTLTLHQPTSHAAARHLRRECIRLGIHVAAVAILLRYAKPYAWACSTFAALHVAHPLLAIPTFASAFYPGPGSYTDASLLASLLWPETIDCLVVNLIHSVTSI